MRTPIVVGLGEVLWDVFPTGPRFGGAPANFACAAAELAGRRARAAMASQVGQDALGDQAMECLREKNVDTKGVARSRDAATGTVTVRLDARGAATYEFASDTAWDRMVWTSELEELAAQSDAVCFGTLGQRCAASRAVIQRFVAATPASCLRIFDINLRPPFYSDSVILESLELANVLKLNEEELPLLAGLCGLAGSPLEILRALADRFDLRAAVHTRGPAGACLIAGDEVSERSGVTVKVVDTVGAGDTFTAAVALGLLFAAPLPEIHARASQAAAFVCTQAGAAPQFPAALRWDGAE
jgi:fructokinase